MKYVNEYLCVCGRRKVKWYPRRPSDMRITGLDECFPSVDYTLVKLLYCNKLTCKKHRIARLRQPLKHLANPKRYASLWTSIQLEWPFWSYGVSLGGLRFATNYIFMHLSTTKMKTYNRVETRNKVSFISSFMSHGSLCLRPVLPRHLLLLFHGLFSE